MNRLRNHLDRHGRFYVSVLLGIAVWFAISFAGLQPAARLLAAGDAFFLSYLASIAFVTFRITPDQLRERAAIEDEGTVLVILIALAVIVVSSAAIVIVFRQRHGLSPLPLSLALAGVPLGWCTLNTIAAFHYADLYYAPRDNGPESVRGLDFPGCKEPGVWEFLYYSFTIGTTAQTSDTNVLDTKMRRATLAHSVVSFFYNAAIIAMAVNAVVAIAS